MAYDASEDEAQEKRPPDFSDVHEERGLEGPKERKNIR